MATRPGVWGWDDGGVSTTVLAAIRCRSWRTHGALLRKSVDGESLEFIDGVITSDGHGKGIRRQMRIWLVVVQNLEQETRR